MGLILSLAVLGGILLVLWTVVEGMGREVDEALLRLNDPPPCNHASIRTVSEHRLNPASGLLWHVRTVQTCNDCGEEWLDD